ncbi:glycoside hydrolase family 64 protein [Piscinibacter sp.]|uniref:glycoside hydrolase family 64 protein n=1 Tax=Piscinibacter sp. TaxID=1903157 RepID=UPI002B50A675|nr:glycoside hydrolase family 64 protein [Albitalea sp.]HUG25525.1 glycoside hydrolase family 64 protein [Albitalea sp.]
MKRMALWLVGLLTSIFCLAPAQAQSAADYTQGVDVSGSTAKIWFKPTSTQTTWVDVHYQHNGGAVQSLRMTFNASAGRMEQDVLTPVATGDSLSYRFTYNKGAPAYNTPTFSFTVGSTGGGGGDDGGSGSGGGGGGGGGSSGGGSGTGGDGLAFTHGVDVSGTTATLWFQPAQSITFVDVHYTVNGGGQQNFRMAASGSRYQQNVITPVASGDVIAYWFTYSVTGAAAYDTDHYSFTVGSGGGGGGGGDDGGGDDGGGDDGGGGGGASWNGMTTFNVVNQTNGRWADGDVYWSIIGRDWNTGHFVHVDRSGNLIPMQLSDNGALTKNGQAYTNYFHKLSELRSVTIPAINSARILMSVGGPMYIQVNVDVNGNIGYAGANIANPSDPNTDVIFDFGEMAILPQGHANQGIFINTTRVDQFGFPLKLRLQGLNGYDRTVGEPLTESRDALFQKFVAETPAPFRGLAQAPYAPYRIMAPSHATFLNGQVNATYLQAYIDAVWARYRNEDLVFTLENLGTFRGRVSGDRFTFTGGHQNGTFFINGKPSTSMAFLGNGFLDDATGGTTDVGTQLQIQAQMCAALNRHVVETPANWHNASFFYPAGQVANWFAKFWHDHSIDRLAYGFAYDDVGGHSPSLHTDAPTAVTYTIGW